MDTEFVWLTAFALVLAGCGSDSSSADGTIEIDAGISSSTGGTSTTRNTVGAGGQTNQLQNTGGLSNTGGTGTQMQSTGGLTSLSAGGTTSGATAGGSAATTSTASGIPGGATAIGGSNAMGGASSGGGLAPTGGTGAVDTSTGTGGQSAITSTPTTGKGHNIGGANATGGISSVGGQSTSGTGGLAGIGGALVSGGSLPTGGVPSVGGSASSAGSCAAVYYRDADGDSWGSSESSCSAAAGWVSRTGDCNDANADVFPGQTSNFSVPYATTGLTQSFDYDCDGSETLEGGVQTSTGQCEASGSGNSCLGDGYVPVEPPRTGTDLNQICGSVRYLVCARSQQQCVAALSTDGSHEAAACR